MELALRQSSQPKNVQYFALDDPYSTYVDEHLPFIQFRLLIALYL